MKLAFRFIYWRRHLPEGGFVFAVCAIGVIEDRHPDTFLVGRSLFDLSSMHGKWFIDILFIHILTFSQLFWKGVW